MTFALDVYRCMVTSIAAASKLSSFGSRFFRHVGLSKIYSCSKGWYRVGRLVMAGDSGSSVGGGGLYALKIPCACHNQDILLILRKVIRCIYVLCQEMSLGEHIVLIDHVYTQKTVRNMLRRLAMYKTD